MPKPKNVKHAAGGKLKEPSLTRNLKALAIQQTDLDKLCSTTHQMLTIAVQCSFCTEPMQHNADFQFIWQMGGGQSEVAQT